MAAKPKSGQAGSGRALALAALTLAFCFFNLMVYADTFKLITLCVLLAAAGALLWRRFGGAMGERLRLPLLPLLGYMLLCALSVLWAQSGKFFLKEYARLLIGFAVFLGIVLCLPRTRRAVRTAAGVLAAAAAVYSLASVDLASTRVTAFLWNLIPNYAGISNGFEAGTRLTGIFGNGNILAGVLGLGVFLSLYLLDDAADRPGRTLWAVCLSLNAFGFLLAFSMGATGFFLLAVLAYLLLAGKRRGSVLLRMLEAAVPTLLFVFAAFPCFAKQGIYTVLPLLCMAANAAVTALLERFVYPALSRRLEGRGRLAGVFIVGMLALVCAYGVLGVTFTTGAELAAGETLRRAVYPQAGANALLLDCDGDLTVTITSQDQRQVMMHTTTTLYAGEASLAEFTVPEGSRVVYLSFKAADGAVLNGASLATGQVVPLDYPLLPGFIANRLQGLWANENAIQRTVFFADGMELFREHPAVGMALGSFESASWGVQEFDYETKYVHNHYIQVLLDSGVVGLALYGGFLISLVWALWKGRRREDEFAPLWAAGAACLLFICTHAVMEVTLSAGCYLPFAFGVFGLLTLCFAPPLRVPQAAPEPKKGRKPAATASRTGGALPQAVRWSCLALTGVYAVLLFLNMSCTSAMKNSRTSYDDFFSALKTDIALDVFEKNDAILSYVINSATSTDAQQLARADAYADQLSQVRSNAIHPYLISYYLQRGNAQGANQAALNGASFNRAGQAVWNSLFAAYNDFLLGDAAGVYPFNQAQAVGGVLELYALMEDYNENVLWSPIVLDDANQALVDWCRAN